MLEVISNMMNRPVLVSLYDREHGHIEQMGGGVKINQSGLVLILRGLSTSWLVVEWKHNGQIVIIPVKDIICISSDYNGLR